MLELNNFEKHFQNSATISLLNAEREKTLSTVLIMLSLIQLFFAEGSLLVVTDFRGEREILDNTENMRLSASSRHKV